MNEKYVHYVMVMVNYGHLWCKIENKTECLWLACNVNLTVAYFHLLYAVCYQREKWSF